ncbi:tyrosine-type recombinase/integrase [Pirellulaceae bacterium SH449]
MAKREKDKETERVPSYRKHVSGQARVTIAGRDYLLGRHGSAASKMAYQKLIAEWLASGGSGSFRTPVEEYTVTQLIADYMTHARSYYKATMRAELNNLRPAMRSWRELYGKTPVIEFGPLQYKAVREHISKQGDRSRTYVNKLCEKIVRALRWAVAEGRIPAEVANAVGMVPGLKRGRTKLREAEEIGPVDDAIVEKTLPHLNEVVRDMVKIQRLCGARPGELCEFRPGLVNRDGDIWEVHLDRHKTSWRGKKRVVYLPKAAQEILLKYLLRPDDMFCFAPREAKKNRAFEIKRKPGVLRQRGKSTPRSRPGYKFTTATYRQSIQRGCEKAFPPPKGLSKAEVKKWKAEHVWSPNQLRHSFATSIRKVAGIESAKALLGHSSINVTEIYAEVDREAAKQALRRMGS